MTNKLIDKIEAPILSKASDLSRKPPISILPKKENILLLIILTKIKNKKLIKNKN